MSNNPDPVPTEKFNVGLRFMGQEIVGLTLESTSTRKVWVAIGILTMIAVGLFVQWTYPFLAPLVGLKP